MFKIGQQVEFEYAPDMSCPRVDFGSDYGSSGIIGVGKIISIQDGIDRDEFTIEFTVYPKTDNEHLDYWNFTLKDKYMPGFPVKIITEQEQKNIDALAKWIDSF